MGCVFMEPGTDATFDTSLFRTVIAGGTATVTSDASVVHTGPRSLKCFTSNDGGNGSAANVYTQSFKLSEANRLSNGRCSFYFRFDTVPNDLDGLNNPDFESIFVFESTTGGGGNVYELAVRDDLKLTLHSTDHTVIGTGSTLSLNTWYRLSVAHNITSTTVNEIRVYLNGVLDISVTNATLFKADPDRAIFGPTYANGTPNASHYFDNIYIDDDGSLADLGDIRVTAKLPVGNNTNNFPTAIGNNPTNRYENVNERPLSQTNGWQDATGTPIDENYTIQGKAVGDIDISAYAGNASANPACGLRNSSANGIKLFECGVCVAYSNTTNQIVAFMSWAFASTVSGSISNLQIWVDGSVVTPADGSRGRSNLALTTTAALVFAFAGVTIPATEPTCTADTINYRYRLDYVLDTQRPAQDVLNDMLATFGGFLVYAGSKVKLKVEKAETVTQYFGDGSTGEK